MSFVQNEAAFRAALDEVIKFNNYANEFNYIQELYSRLVHVFIKGKRMNFSSLFDLYDTDADELLTKDDVRSMMIDADMAHVTLAEAAFVFNIMSHFKMRMKPGTFQNWAESMVGVGQKRLIQFTQYMNVANE